MNPIEQAPLVIYILAMTLTPGPSSLLIAASGARFGLARCRAHLVGSLVGWELQLLAATIGTGSALLAEPDVQFGMQLMCTAYLLFLGWRMLGSRTREGELPAAAPLQWQSAAALQLANPKSWLTAIASAGLFLPATAPVAKQGAFLVYAGGTGITGLTIWAVAGAAMQRWLTSPARQSALNRSMAAAMASAAVWGLCSASAA